MFGKPKSKPLVGLDIGSSSVKAVELKRKGSAYELVNLGVESLGQDTVVDGAIMDALSVSQAIEKIFTDSKIKTKDVATAVSGHSVIVKKIGRMIAPPALLTHSGKGLGDLHAPSGISRHEHVRPGGGMS